MTRPPPGTLARLAFSLALLAGLLAWLEPATIAAELDELALGWVVLGLLTSLPQVVVSAWRWRLTARLLDVPLSRAAAFREYYLATFLNQLLPGGVMGDVARAWRHAGASGARRAAVRAVVIERTSGQLVLWGVTALALLTPVWQAPLALAGDTLAALPGTAQAAAVLGLSGLAAGLITLYRRPPRALAGLGGDLARTLLATAAWPRQLLGSLAVVTSYIAVYLCAARAAGAELPTLALMALVPPVLMAMALPLSVAGWGLREGAAALVWSLVGLPAAQGVAISMTYGLLVLLASLPGALCLLRRWRGVGERQVEQQVLAADEVAHRRAARPVEGIDGGQGQAGAPGADEQRRHQDVQTVQHVGIEKARDSDAAALDQHPRQPLGSQRRENRGGGDVAGRDIQLEMPDMRADPGQGRHAAAYQVPGRGQSVLEDDPRGGQAAARVEDHPTGVAALDVTHGQLRVVGGHGAGPDQHGIDQGPQAMQVDPAGQAVDVVRGAGFGGDAPVEALSQLGDGQRPGARHQRQQAVEEVTYRLVEVAIAAPGATTAHLEGHPLGRETGDGDT